MSIKLKAIIVPAKNFALVKKKMLNLAYTCCYLFLLLLIAANSSPPPDHIKCKSNNTDCTITNSYGIFSDRTTCQAANVAYPTTEQELISTVAEASRAKRKMRVVTRYSHSIPKLVCPDGPNGLVISTKYLNRTLGIDTVSGTMTVESGATLRQIIEDAAKAGLALPYAPYWWGLSIGGLMSTGAHGSTLWGKGSAVHDYVIGLTVVSSGGAGDGFVKIRRLEEGQNDSELNAAKVSLGVLGVISKVTLKLQPLFKRSISYAVRDDSDLGDEAARFGSQHEFADILWYPSQRKAAYRIDDRVPLNTSGNGLYNAIAFRPTLTAGLAVIRATEEAQESLSDTNGKCSSARLITSGLRTVAYGLTNNGVIFTGYPVIGYQNRLQSSGTCLDSRNDAMLTACPWDPRIKGTFFFQSTFSINLSYVKNFIKDVQNLVQLDPKSLCVLEQYNGILMRYVTKSSAYLGKEEDAIDFDITYYRSKDPMTPRLYEDVIEEIEQIALYKYGGIPHWGKNRNMVFDRVMNKYKDGGEFLKVKEEFDPSGLFSSEWTDRVLGLKGSVVEVKEGCALEGLCVCSQDVHCAPSKGYFCRPGKVYPDARVCALIKKK